MTFDKQYRSARDAGWITLCIEAAEFYGQDAATILAIGSRETDLNPKYLKVPGDNGHGFGLTQADIRSNRAWVEAGLWKDARECFFFTAKGLRDRIAHFRNLEGKTGLKVRSSQGCTYTYDGAKFGNENDLVRVAIAAYNCGDFAYYHYSKTGQIDKGTTPGPSGHPDYSSDVLARARYFREWMRKDDLCVIKATQDAQPNTTENPAPASSSRPDANAQGTAPSNADAAPTSQAGMFDTVKQFATQENIAEAETVVDAVKSKAGLLRTIGTKLTKTLGSAAAWLYCFVDTHRSATALLGIFVALCIGFAFYHFRKDIVALWWRLKGGRS